MSHLIQNFAELATTDARRDALRIAEAGLAAILTPAVIRSQVSLAGDMLTVAGETYDLTQYDEIVLLGVGKCAFDAALELEAVLGERLTRGIVIDVRAPAGLSRVRVLAGTHPYPSDENVAHTRELLHLAESLSERSLALVVISGGGSTLLCAPLSHTAAEEKELIVALFRAGATISELNTVRKHISRARGGGLAAALRNTRTVALIFSDVPGDDLAVISSGPTVPDETSVEDAHAVLEKYGIAEATFSRTHLMESHSEPGLFAKVRNILALTNKTALDAMQKEAEALGYAAGVQDRRITGEARDVGSAMARTLHDVPARTAYLYGGETTVTIHGHGKGGRNEELALGALRDVREGELVLSLASDGRDNTDLAGAIADTETLRRAREVGLDHEAYLAANDSLSYFSTLHQGIVTGYTGANIADLAVTLKQ